ncbi:MAG: GNAT family N-acetyltransferase [Ruminococcus sp.]|nr:GNAT family N-acetyltransferase [Ruminococcus sp.]
MEPKIRRALPEDLSAVCKVVRETIRAVYPRYYPAGAVELFLSYHSDEAIAADISEGIVFVSEPEGSVVGTVTVRRDEVCRMFVLPQFQGRGFGGELLRFAESEIGKSFGTARLDASLSAKGLYLRRNYMTIDFSRKTAQNGDFLCYDTMIKRL